VSQPTPEIRRTAFIDESTRLGTSGGLYLVAAAVVIDADSDDVERQLRTATGRRRHRIHWRNESDAVRLRFLDVLAGQPVQGISVAVEPTTARRQERARAQGWWTLTWHLAERNVTEIVMEAVDHYGADACPPAGRAKRVSVPDGTICNIVLPAQDRQRIDEVVAHKGTTRSALLTDVLNHARNG
jgi:hypothetical protein